MKLRTVEIDGKTYAEVQDGKPVYDGDDGKPVAFDVPGAAATMTSLRGEAMRHREAKEAAETKLKAFDGLDAAGARDALDKLSRIDAKKLVEAGDMDAAIQAALKPLQEQLASANKTVETLTGSLNGEKIGNAFGRSKFVTEKLTPAGADLVRSMFGDRLKVEDGKITGYDANGQKLFSKANPGILADFDEIVESLVEAYPYKDHILAGTGGHGGGAKDSSGGGSGAKTMSRADFDRLDAPAKHKAMVVDKITLTD